MWDVVGLRGTGSDGFAVEDLFVPEAHTTAREDQAERRDRSPLYGVSSYSLYACGFAAVALGVARSLLDQLLRLAAEKTPRGYRSTLRQDGALQADVGEAEARLRAARMYLFGTLGELWDGVQRSGAATLDQRMAVRLAATWSIRTAKEVANVAYDAAGATAVFAANPFERRFRDMHTLAQQVQGRKAHFATVGQYLLGLEADTTWL
jgi:alkylation response protein AidB-like acyl-CoA dehydrogenase